MSRRLLLLLLLLFVPRPALAATYYISAASHDCTVTSGSGTIGDPWTNLNNALRTRSFSAGDIIYLRGGTYRNKYQGFGDDCEHAGGGNGTNPILPINIAGSSGNPIIIQNYPGEDVVLDGSDWDLEAATSSWTACGTSSWQLDTPAGASNPTAVTSARSGQIWVNPGTGSNTGTRLTYSSGTSCAGMSAGTFRYDSNGNNLYIRMPDSSDVNNADVRMSCEAGECSNYLIDDGASTAWVTVRKNPSGGTFRLRFGYYSIRADNSAAHDVNIEGLEIYAAGGRDYGSCVRVHDPSDWTFTDLVCREASGEGLQAYGGGPGGGSQPGIQIARIDFIRPVVSYTGFSAADGGMNGNNLGYGIIIKNCNDCQVIDGTVSAYYAIGIYVTTSTDVGESDGVLIEGNTISDGGYKNSSLGNRTLSCISLEPQRSATNGAVRNTTVQNNICHNSEFGSGATWSSSHASGQEVHGIQMDDGGMTPMTGNLIVNNSFDQFTGALIYAQNVSASFTWRNNALGSTFSTGAGTQCTGSVDCSAQLPSVATTHSNNGFWAGAGGTVVISVAGGTTYTRATATSFEASAVVVDPQFTSATNLHLQAGSGLINAGTSTNCPSTDIDGATRSSCDIGADEYAATTRRLRGRDRLDPGRGRDDD